MTRPMVKAVKPKRRQNVNDDRRRSGHQMFFQFTLLDQFPVLARPVELELLQRLAAR